MEIITIHKAKATLAKLLARVEAGEEIVLARGKKQIGKLVPNRPPVTKRQFGALRGVISVRPEFFEQLPDRELAAWELRRAVDIRRIKFFLCSLVYDTLNASSGLPWRAV